MFRFFRNARARKTIETSLRQTLAPLTMFGRQIPNSIFEDPYALGYLNAVSAFGALLATQGKSSVEDVGKATIAAYQSVFGLLADRIAANVIRYSTDKNERFLHGQRNANRMIQVIYGELGPDADHEIAHAFSVAEEMRISPDQKPASIAAAYLGQVYFYNYIKENHPPSEDG